MKVGGLNRLSSWVWVMQVELGSTSVQSWGYVTYFKNWFDTGWGLSGRHP